MLHVFAVLQVHEGPQEQEELEQLEQLGQPAQQVRQMVHQDQRALLEPLETLAQLELA